MLGGLHRARRELGQLPLVFSVLPLAICMPACPLFVSSATTPSCRQARHAFIRSAWGAQSPPPPGLCPTYGEPVPPDFPGCPPNPWELLASTGETGRRSLAIPCLSLGPSCTRLSPRRSLCCPLRNLPFGVAGRKLPGSHRLGPNMQALHLQCIGDRKSVV